MTALDLLTVVLVLGGLGFFVAGTVALVRFPDLYCRIHAITKADTLGLGFVALAVALQQDSLAHAVKVVVIYVAVLAASATSGFLIAARSRSDQKGHEMADGR